MFGDIFFLLVALKLCQAELKIFHFSSQESKEGEPNSQMPISAPHAHLWCSIGTISGGSSSGCSALRMALCPYL